MMIRLTVVCLIFAAFALAFGALVSNDTEKFISMNASNRCAFDLPCNPKN
jgi:hypothetical protein